MTALASPILAPKPETADNVNAYCVGLIAGGGLHTAIDLFAAHRHRGTTDGNLVDTLSAAQAIGDLFYASGANALTRLAKGTAFQLLRQNAGATAPEWATLASEAVVATSQTTNSSTYNDLATVGPAVTVTTGTSAIVVVSAELDNDTATRMAAMSFALSGASTIAASDDHRLALFASGVSTPTIRASAMSIITGLTPGSNTFTGKYRVDLGIATISRRRILVIPI